MTFLHTSIRGLENALGANRMRLLYTVQIALILAESLLTLLKTGLTKSCLLLRVLHHLLPPPLQPLAILLPFKQPPANHLFMRIGPYQVLHHQLLESFQKGFLVIPSPVKTVTPPYYPRMMLIYAWVEWVIQMKMLASLRVGYAGDWYVRFAPLLKEA